MTMSDAECAAVTDKISRVRGVIDLLSAVVDFEEWDNIVGAQAGFMDLMDILSRQLTESIGEIHKL